MMKGTKKAGEQGTAGQQGKTEAVAENAGGAPPKKQAVIVIHGIGEQVPMATLRGFVDAVWSKDIDLIDTQNPDCFSGKVPRDQHPTWTKPDRRNRSFELRRITTEASRTGKRADFYEFYWAHLTHGSTWEMVKSWFLELLVRSPKNVPADVMPIWLTVWSLLIAAVTLVVPFVRRVIWPDAVNMWMTDMTDMMAAHPFWTSAAITGIIGAVIAFLRRTIVNYGGDVVRYIKADPPNVARRQEIREKGVELLETLMGVTPEAVKANRQRQRKGKPLKWKSEYDRIIIVGHSLGTIIAYDILKYSFARVNRWFDNEEAEQPHRAAQERYLQRCLGISKDEQKEVFSTQRYRRYQRASLDEMNRQGNPWIVSDFVTLGSPLTHAEFLLAADLDDLDKQRKARILPVCPPILEWDRDLHQDSAGQQNAYTHRSFHFSYFSSDGDKETYQRVCKTKTNPNHFRYPHHAAHFAYTRWSNIYSPADPLFWGDLISGPLGRHFGLHFDESYGDNIKAPVHLQGIEDIAVLPERDERGKAKTPVPFFTHTKYWGMGKGSDRPHSYKVQHHIRVLRRALDLLNRRDRWHPDSD